MFNIYYFLFRFISFFFFFSSRRRHTRLTCDWSSDVCSSDLKRFSSSKAGSRTECLLRSIREPAFDELNRFLQACFRRHDYVDVVRHDYELMQQVGCPAIVIQSIDQQLRPAFFLEERAPAPGG